MNMERPNPTHQQQITSFNPEAAAFSPVSSSPMPQSAVQARATRLEPPDAQVLPLPIFASDPGPSDQQLRGPDFIQSSHPSDPVILTSVCLEEFQVLDAQAVVRKLEEHSKQESDIPQTPASETTRAADTVAHTLPSFIFPAPQTQFAYPTVGINELSAGLGLPAMKPSISDESSPVTSQTCRSSQAYPGALYGKLIGWALDKPLTAKGLAEYLRNPELHNTFEHPASTLVSSNESAHCRDAEVRHHRPEAKPAQGVDQSDLYLTVMRVPTKVIHIPKGPSALQHRYHRSSNSSASYSHHTRNMSMKRYPRRASRAKRMDQGPMPSAADIYPDDANWIPPVPLYEGSGHAPYTDQPIERSHSIVDNVFDWPPPAQVYKPEPAPTAADICAADHDVLALMAELPDPTFDTLVKLGSSYALTGGANVFDLPCSESVLTPAQLNGSRYGIRFYGIAYGDQWEVPSVGHKDKSFKYWRRD